MRRPLVAGLAACLLVGGAVAPATAAKKKPKKKPPVTFQEEGSVAIGHPGDVAGEANVTRTAFLESCSIPPSQGTDGYVIALPEEITAGPANVSITGGDLSGLHDLDIHFFDDSCTPTGALNTELADEFGLMPAGTAFVLVTAFGGAEITFAFEAEGV